MLKKLFRVFTNKFYIKLLYIFISLSFATIISDLPYFNLLNTAILGYGLLLVIYNFFEVIILKRRKFFIFEIALYSFLVLTLIFNLKFYYSIENLKSWIVNVLLMTVIFSIDVHKNKNSLNFEVNLISYFYSIMAFLFSIISILIIYFNEYFGDLNKYFASSIGLFKNENSFGISASISILISIFLFINIKKLSSKVFNVINIIFQIFCLIISNGRSGYLIILSLLFVYILFLLKKTYQRVLFILIPFSVFIMSLRILSNEILYKFLTGRQYIWRSALRVIDAFPLYGVGLLQRNNKVEEFRVDILHGVKAGGVHNIFLEISVANGLIVALIFILFLITLYLFIFRKINTLSKSERISYFIIFSLIMGISFANMLESSLTYIISFISIIFWIYSGYLVALLNNKNNLK